MEEAEARGESEGEATVVEGAESDSQVVEVTVLRRAGLPLEGTAVEAILGVDVCVCVVNREQYWGRNIPCRVAGEPQGMR